MTQDELIAQLAASGRPWTPSSTGAGVWLEVPGGRVFRSWDRLARDMAPPPARSAIGVPHFNGDPNRFASGRSRWRQNVGQREDICIPDMASADMRHRWPDYVVQQDAQGKIIQEGPKPFRSKSEQVEYCRLAGYTVGGADERPPECTDPRYSAAALGLSAEKDALADEICGGD